MQLSNLLRAELERALGAPLLRARPLAGGDINEAYEVELGDARRCFVKVNSRAPRGMFAAEARGLAWLDEAHALRVPRVLIEPAEDALWLALELVRPAARLPDFDERLGRGLARLHAAGARGFGLEHDNFLGTLAQSNTPAGDWASFYRDRRLPPLIERASRARLLEPTERAVLDRLLERVPELVGPAERPARLHGDLWTGNVHRDERGEPVLIDPAAYGGHREMDLAMLALFGEELPARLLAAYEELTPLAPGFPERLALWQLYPLLAHLCLFGAPYRAQVTSAARRALAVATSRP